MFLKSKNKISNIVHNSMFSVVSLLLAFLGNLTLFPVFPYLKADISDMPIFLATLVSGIPSGITVLMTVSIIRALLFSSSGWIGFLMRTATIVIIVALGIAKNKSKTQKVLIITLGIVLYVIVKLSLNYFCWITFFSISKTLINSLLITIILPYNALKVLIGLLLAFIIYSHLNKYLKRKSI